MKSVLISIQPKWCELIASGQKTVEVRKSKPKLETPFKVYIYATKPQKQFDYGLCLDEGRVGLVCKINYELAKSYNMEIISGKVLGEFVCDSVEIFRYDALDMAYMARKHRDTKLLSEEFFKGTQVTYQEAYDYCEGMDWGENYSDLFYGWRISDLKIYDKPRELSEFYAEGDCDYKNCSQCGRLKFISASKAECDLEEGYKPITRPPQSWCYVESEDTE